MQGPTDEVKNTLHAAKFLYLSVNKVLRLDYFPLVGCQRVSRHAVTAHHTLVAVSNAALTQNLQPVDIIIPQGAELLVQEYFAVRLGVVQTRQTCDRTGHEQVVVRNFLGRNKRPENLLTILVDTFVSTIDQLAMMMMQQIQLLLDEPGLP